MESYIIQRKEAKFFTFRLKEQILIQVIKKLFKRLEEIMYREK
jgi:hypothetical protein